MKKFNPILILFMVALIFSCGSEDDDSNQQKIIVETWKIESIVVNDLYDFNGDNDYSGNVTEELGCFSFDTYVLYNDGSGNEEVIKNIALYFDSNSGSVVGVCQELNSSQTLNISWSGTDTTRTFTFQNFSGTGNIENDLIVFQEIDFPIYTDETLTSIEILIPATFTYRLQ